MLNAPNFSLSEFEAVSHTTLDSVEISRAEQHAEYLQMVRDSLNAQYPLPTGATQWLIILTSYVRTTDPTDDHYTGSALDWEVQNDLDRTDDETANKWARDWLAANRANLFDRLLYEYDHNHTTLRGTGYVPVLNPPAVYDLIPGSVGADSPKGNFVLANVPIGVTTAGLALAVGAGIALLFLRGKGA